MKTEIKQDKVNGTTVGYKVFKNGIVTHYITQGGNGWNLNEGDNPISGWLETYDTLRDAKQAVKEME